MALCAIHLRATLLRRVSPVRCNASFPVNQPVAVRCCFPAILIAEYPNPAFTIPAQPVGAEPSVMAVINGSNRTLAQHRHPDQPINILHSLDLRLDNTHSLNDTRPWFSSSPRSIVYNTVILASRDNNFVTLSSRRSQRMPNWLLRLWRKIVGFRHTQPIPTPTT